jgi:hypothetical protein
MSHSPLEYIRHMKKHIGSTLDSLFEELGEKQDVDLLTHKRLLAGRIAQAMAPRKFTQTDLAHAMHTSRRRTP